MPIILWRFLSTTASDTNSFSAVESHHKNEVKTVRDMGFSLRQGNSLFHHDKMTFNDYLIESTAELSMLSVEVVAKYNLIITINVYQQGLLMPIGTLTLL